MTVRLMLGQLAHLREAGFEVIVLASPGQDLERVAERDGVQWVAVPMAREIAGLADLVSLWRLCRLMRRLRPTITNVSTPKAGLLGGLAAWLSGVPCRVYTLRGLRCETVRGPKRKALVFTERIACGCAHQVFCVSESVRQKAVALGLVDMDRTVVLGSGSSNGVDAARFAPTAELLRVTSHLRGDLGIPLETPVMGYVGRFTRDKGIPQLLEAYSQLRVSFPKLRLLLVGEFEKGDSLSPEVRERILRDPYIISCGFVPDTAPYYHLMNVLALPSHREGFPNAVLEAQAAGKAVVASRATGTVDAIIDGVTGILVPPGDAKALATALKRLLQNRDIAEAMGRTGRARVLREFRQELIWAALAREYTRLLREKSLPVPSAPAVASFLSRGSS